MTLNILFGQRGIGKVTKSFKVLGETVASFLFVYVFYYAYVNHPFSFKCKD